MMEKTLVVSYSTKKMCDWQIFY